jgi:hypothetical protein
MFAHDFAADMPLEKSFPLVKQKYNRRIERFLNKLSDKNAKVLLFYIEEENNEPLFDDTEKLKILCGRLCDKFNKVIDFVFVRQLPLGSVNTMSALWISDNIIKYELHYDLDGRMPSNKEYRFYYKSVFKNIRLKLTKDMIISRLKRLIILFVSNLVINRKLKLKIRSLDKTTYEKF